MSTIGELGRYRPQLMSFALRRLRNREQAEDAVQETLLAALESIDRFSGGSSLGTWLIGILKHKMIDALRLSSREEPLDYDEDMCHQTIRRTSWRAAGPWMRWTRDSSSSLPAPRAYSCCAR